MTGELVTVRHTDMARTDSWSTVVEDIGLLASRIAVTEFVPEAMRGKPAAVAAAILYGREIGLPPMTALQSVNVIKGKVALSSEAMRGLILAAGHDFYFAEATSARCVARGRRAGTDQWSEVTWTMDTARQAGLVSNPSWRTYPRQMLKARATAELARDLFADVIAGFVAVEEIDGGQDASTTAEPPTSARRRVRRADAVPDVPSPPMDNGAATPPPGQDPTTGPVVGGLPLPGEPGYEAVLPTVPASPASGPLPEQTDDDQQAGSPGKRDTADWNIHAAQRVKVLTLFKDLGVDRRDIRLRVTSLVVGHAVDTTNALTRGEASVLIDTLVLWLNTKGMKDAFTAVMAEPDPMAAMDAVMKRIAAARETATPDA